MDGVLFVVMEVWKVLSVQTAFQTSGMLTSTAGILSVILVVQLLAGFWLTMLLCHTLMTKEQRSRGFIRRTFAALLLIRWAFNQWRAQKTEKISTSAKATSETGCLSGCKHIAQSLPKILGRSKNSGEKISSDEDFQPGSPERRRLEADVNDSPVITRSKKKILDASSMLSTL